MLPDAIIIGVKKSGTCALGVLMSLHPHVLSVRKEAHFFDEIERYSLGLKEYIRMLPRRSWSGQLLIEKTPAYFFEPEVEKRIQAAMPDVKLLLVVREPVTRMISEYIHNRIWHLNHSMAAEPFEVEKTLYNNGCKIVRVYLFMSLCLNHKHQ